MSYAECNIKFSTMDCAKRNVMSAAFGGAL